jgi:tetratricopeptide (TPR) repeat protein
MRWDFAAAEKDLKRAITIAPGDMMIPLFYESFLCFSGRGDEAIESLKFRTEKRKPVGLEGRYVERQSMHYLWAGRYNEALEELKKVPISGPILPWNLAVAKALSGDISEALAIMRDIRQLASRDFEGQFLSDYACILALAGRREEALQALKEHIAIQTRKNIGTALYEARVHAALGDKDKAIELLNKSFEDHSTQILMLFADWFLHSLHGDPRFEELARRVGFPVIPK